MLRKTVATLVLSAIAVQAQAAQEIQWWHALGGQLGETVEKMVAEYNNSQDVYEVKPVYKGNYTETMTTAIAAFRAEEQPHIVQVFEVGTATMMNAHGAIYPVHELMQETGNKDFSSEPYLDAVASYYTTQDGKLLSLPFNSSTPVMFYNKDAMKKAGLDPNQPPQTWTELADMSQKIIDADAATCGFTTGWPSWVQIENMSAWHDKPIATQANGFGGLSTELTINSDFQVGHMQNLADWQEDRIFVYGGRRGDSNPLFMNSECWAVMNSSAYYDTFAEGTNFEWGVTKLPYYANEVKEPQNSIIGGATLWVLNGHDEAEYKGVADFFEYLSSAEAQYFWHSNTGYVPITDAAFELAEERNLYASKPGKEVAVQQLTLNPPTANSKGLRLGNFVQVRDIIEQEMENIFVGKKTPQKGLDDAVTQGNKLLRKFESAND
ncbi:sn-glycerol-3-phosphate ABC transporter substrate-binding protein UgpB [Vreelandella salicampi]|uniref:sn-glycerol-3-phosphate-binding periplasmic protein UgpB n=1 Tax=Vreelandella salicampi TaxID=1449798 RepID=A0A7Z0RWB5_9GAMM|nr:sn-glycerol-3-phosphate ABC transporter substrate-binding protein UgpB [Halomonas salicampi]NYS62065.1 sn-glycerol-3-phosphate ABC transporter substrate-binding protein UgpB [Halomonas salicampi]